MSFSKLIKSKNNYNFYPNDVFKRLYKGACVKIKNSEKTFQVVGINPKREVCWLREWPIPLEFCKTFSLKTNQITIQTTCSNNFTDN